ncbi:hypothetical protein E2C01_047507 [Portunus trituberculatus]|uniref:Uncharacterized protein n=1 Tax=Portunus trituberculatus TaxID=210409 RepID=A0A5B7G826_PORTR|nr:hypothetical protein [Portunus trituberculatus]
MNPLSEAVRVFPLRLRTLVLECLVNRPVYRHAALLNDRQHGNAITLFKAPLQRSSQPSPLQRALRTLNISCSMTVASRHT